MSRPRMAAHGLRRLGELRHRLRHELRIAQVRIAGQAVDLEQARQVEQARDADTRRRRRGRGPSIRNCSTRRGVGLDLQADGGAAAALADLLLDGLEQVLHFVVVDFDVAVARDAEDGVALQGHAGEQVRQVQADDRFQRREDVSGAARLGRQRHEARQHGRHLHDGEQLSRRRRAAAAHGQVERLVEQVRERMARVDGQRRQHREDLAAEDLAQVPLVGVGQVLEAAEDDALALPGRAARLPAGSGSVSAVIWRTVWPMRSSCSLAACGRRRSRRRCRPAPSAAGRRRGP